MMVKLLRVASNVFNVMHKSKLQFKDRVRVNLSENGTKVKVFYCYIFLFNPI